MKRVITNLSSSLIKARDYEGTALCTIATIRVKTQVPHDVSLAVLSVLSLLFSAITYETSFSEHRTHSNCLYQPHDTYPYIVLLLTLLSAVVLLFRYHSHNEPRTLLGRIIYLCEFMILVPFQYPSNQGNLIIPQVSIFLSISGKGVTYNICYKINEILYLGSLFRIYFCFKLLVKYLEHKRTIYSSDMYINQKSLIRILFFIFWLVTISVLMVLGEFLRVSERPYSDISNQNFDSYLSALWCLATSLTSIGYGDLFPSTYLGRAICFISSGFGALIFSVVIYTICSFVMINRRDEQLLLEIQNTRCSGEVVKAAVMLSYFRKVHGGNSEVVRRMWMSLLKKIKERKSDMKRNKRNEIQREKEKYKSKYVATRLERIEQKINKFGLKIN